MNDSLTSQVERDGFALLPRMYSVAEVDAMTDNLAAALTPLSGMDSSIRIGSGGVYAARNVLSLFPAVANVWQKPPVVAFLRDVLGDEFGLVRVLFFDKPPERTWSLPWHKDVTIAVADPDGTQSQAYRVHVKVGVPHVEPPTEVLNAMLSLRLHLDDVTDENGPLKVVAGSHRSGKRLSLDDGPRVSILANRGDVLAVRPLVAHCSGRSVEGTHRHRRILHLEFSGSRHLPDGFRWRDFIGPGSDSISAD